MGVLKGTKLGQKKRKGEWLEKKLAPFPRKKKTIPGWKKGGECGTLEGKKRPLAPKSEK